MESLFGSCLLVCKRALHLLIFSNCKITHVQYPRHFLPEAISTPQKVIVGISNLGQLGFRSIHGFRLIHLLSLSLIPRAVLTLVDPRTGLYQCRHNRANPVPMLLVPNSFPGSFL